MADEFTISFASDDKEAALVQMGYMKAYLDDYAIESNQRRKKIGKDEAGGELLPILTVLTPLAIEIIKNISSWIKSKDKDADAKVAKLKVKITNKNGDEVEFDASDFSKTEQELVDKLSEKFRASG